MNPAEIAVPLVRRWEGFRANPYLCPAGVPTIAFGCTRYEDGRAVQLTDPAVSLLRGEELLQHDLGGCLVSVQRLCPGLEGNRAAALASFVFNLGAGRLRASTLRRRVNAGEFDQVPAEFAKWVMAEGRKLPGLVGRRADEARLFMGA